MSFTLRGSSSALLALPPCKPSRTHPPRSAADKAALLYLRPYKPSRLIHPAFASAWLCAPSGGAAIADARHTPRSTSLGRLRHRLRSNTFSHPPCFRFGLALRSFGRGGYRRRSAYASLHLPRSLAPSPTLQHLLTSSTHALQLRSSAFLLAHPGVWKLAALALRSLRQALRASRAERRTSGVPSGWELQVGRVVQPTPKPPSVKPYASQLNITALIVLRRGKGVGELRPPPSFPPLQAQ